MKPLISFLHYASPPTVGGVEATIAQQARVLCGLGYRVRVISGEGGPFDPRIESVVDPLFGSQQPDILALNVELAAGHVSPAFYAMVDVLRAHLQQALGDSAVCIVHNAHTLHKNLALTAALRELLDEPGAPRFIAWARAPSLLLAKR